MCQSFGSMGASSAEREIELAEQSPSTSVRSETKPFTTKVDSHVIESLDAVAASMGISRNTLVVKLINQYLPYAFQAYNESRYAVFDHVCSNMEEKNSEQFVLNALSDLTKTSDLSDEAKEYLQRGIVGLVVGEEYL